MVTFPEQFVVCDSDSAAGSVRLADVVQHVHYLVDRMVRPLRTE
jgi:hypothetical protein